MTVNYLGRKKPNKFVALSLSIVITIKENKDLDGDHQESPDNLGWSPNVGIKQSKR